MCEASDQGFKTNVSLQRIAEALGGSVESLFEVKGEANSLDEARELLCLWAALRGEASRADVLRAVRTIAAARSN